MEKTHEMFLNVFDIENSEKSEFFCIILLVKIRSDFVSNSSSSSFIILGNRLNAVPNDIDENIVFIACDSANKDNTVFIFKLTPELKIYADLCGIDIEQYFKIYLAKYVIHDGYSYFAEDSMNEETEWEWSSFDKHQTELKNGVELNGLKMISLDLDYDCPKNSEEIKIFLSKLKKKS